MSRGPGKWQRVILSQLVEEEGFLLGNCLYAHLGRDWRHSEYTAIGRAAVLLAKSDLCQVERVWGENARGVRAALVWVSRPGVAVEGKARTGFEERRGMRPPG